MDRSWSLYSLSHSLSFVGMEVAARPRRYGTGQLRARPQVSPHCMRYWRVLAPLLSWCMSLIWSCCSTEPQALEEGVPWCLLWWSKNIYLYYEYTGTNNLDGVGLDMAATSIASITESVVHRHRIALKSTWEKGLGQNFAPLSQRSLI